MWKLRFSNQNTLTGSLRGCPCRAARWLTPSYSDNIRRVDGLCCWVLRAWDACISYARRTVFFFVFLISNIQTQPRITLFVSRQSNSVLCSDLLVIVVSSSWTVRNRHIFVVRSRSSLCIMNVWLWCVVIVITDITTIKRVSRLWPVNISFVFLLFEMQRPSHRLVGLCEIV